MSAGDLGDALQCLRNLRFVTFGAQFFKLGNLSIAHCFVVDLQDVDLVFGRQLVFVHANNHIFAAVNSSLLVSRGFFDP